MGRLDDPAASSDLHILFEAGKISDGTPRSVLAETVLFVNIMRKGSPCCISFSAIARKRTS